MFEKCFPSDYKKASTDLIAYKAGVSKGLLFYYFQNKKDLYLTVFEHVKQTVTEGVTDSHFLEITDFFELINLKRIDTLSEFGEIDLLKILFVVLFDPP